MIDCVTHHSAVGMKPQFLRRSEGRSSMYDWAGEPLESRSRAVRSSEGRSSMYDVRTPQTETYE